MSPVSRATPAGRAYFDLQSRARREGRGTQEYLTAYVVERWLARLSRSSYASQFVLKGGVLLAAFGQRRPTVDADALAIGIANDAETVAARVAEIAAIEDPEWVPTLWNGMVPSSSSLITEGREIRRRSAVSCVVSSRPLGMRVSAMPCAIAVTTALRALKAEAGRTMLSPSGLTSRVIRSPAVSRCASRLTTLASSGCSSGDALSTRCDVAAVAKKSRSLFGPAMQGRGGDANHARPREGGHGGHRSGRSVRG
jgi:hypothetical protein